MVLLQDGYALEGQQERECVFGTWSGYLPHCVHRGCPKPRSIAHGGFNFYGQVGIYAVQSLLYHRVLDHIQPSIHIDEFCAIPVLSEIYFCKFYHIHNVCGPAEDM